MSCMILWHGHAAVQLHRRFRCVRYVVHLPLDRDLTTDCRDFSTTVQHRSNVLQLAAITKLQQLAFAKISLRVVPHKTPLDCHAAAVCQTLRSSPCSSRSNPTRSPANDPRPSGRVAIVPSRHYQVISDLVAIQQRRRAARCFALRQQRANEMPNPMHNICANIYSRLRADACGRLRCRPLAAGIQNRHEPFDKARRRGRRRYNSNHVLAAIDTLSRDRAMHPSDGDQW